MCAAAPRFRHHRYRQSVIRLTKQNDFLKQVIKNTDNYTAKKINKMYVLSVVYIILHIFRNKTGSKNYQRHHPAFNKCSIPMIINHNSANVNIFFQYSVFSRMSCTARCPQFIIIGLWHVLEATWEILNDMRLPYKPTQK